jgi:hypothetical protein
MARAGSVTLVVTKWFIICIILSCWFSVLPGKERVVYCWLPGDEQRPLPYQGIRPVLLFELAHSCGCPSVQKLYLFYLIRKNQIIYKLPTSYNLRLEITARLHVSFFVRRAARNFKMAFSLARRSITSSRILSVFCFKPSIVCPLR